MIKLNKRVSRVSHATIREAGKDRDIVIEIEPPGLVFFRAKGCKRRYGLPANALYMICLKAHVESERAAKRKLKCKNRKAK